MRQKAKPLRLPDSGFDSFHLTTIGDIEHVGGGTSLGISSSVKKNYKVQSKL